MNTVATLGRAFGFYLLLQLVACTAPVKPAAVADPRLEWQERQVHLKQIDSWKIDGRLAVTNKAEVWHISVKWQQDQGNYKIHLSGPFGAGAVSLVGDKHGVVIKSGDDTTYASDVEKLLFETTGIQIPIQDLFYWVRGLPNPDSQTSNQIIDKYGRLKKLSQQDWKIRFKRYDRVKNIDLPSKIFIKKKSVDIRLIVEKWIVTI